MQVEDPQVPAPPVDMLDPLDVLLVQRNFLQREDLTLVVLGPSADHVLCDWRDRTHTRVRHSEGWSVMDEPHSLGTL